MSDRKPIDEANAEVLSEAKEALPPTPSALAENADRQNDSVVVEAPPSNGTTAKTAPDAVDDAAEAAGSRLEGAEDDEDKEPELLPRGNPLRMRGLATIAIGAVPAFLLMAKNGQNWWAVPLGVLFVIVAAWGVMDLLGTFDDPDEQVATRTELGAVLPSLALSIVMLGFFCGALSLSQAAVWPWWVSSITVTGTFLALVACVYRFGAALGPWKTDELGLDRPLHQRHGFWVVAIGALLYFPAMGLQSLWDPWETHYGEVAREILARDDWVSLWWAQDGWFWSKPILNFWIQSLAMASLGTHYRPDMMLTGAAGAWTAQPEWAVRAPNVLMTIVAMYLLYKGVAKVFGRRAGLLGAIVLATLPDWFFLAHQTMTDMPFVAAMTGAMGLLLKGLNTPAEDRAKVYEVRAFGAQWRLSVWHLVFGVILVCAIPQILYLLSRNIELVLFGDGPKGFRLHFDEFKSGSAGNCGLPGNEACTMHAAASVPKSVGAHPQGAWPSIVRYVGAFEPSLQALAWSAVLGGALYLNWGERRTRRLLYIGAWLCAALATMGKGPAGFLLPMICAFAYVATKRRWSEILCLEIITGILVILAVAIPWYVAMYVRHGPQFTDRLIYHDMFNRALGHVHDTNEGDDTGIRFYIWQLGYALFPWTGLAPLGLLWGFRRSDSAMSRMGVLARARDAVSSLAARVVGTIDHGSRQDVGAGVGAGARVVGEDASDESGTAEGTAVGDASVMLVMWFVFAFALFTFMGTKFHHYIFPAVPPVAMLLGVVLDDVLGDAPLVRRGALPAYVGLLVVATGLATWGISRAWPGSIFGAAPSAAAEGSALQALLIGGVGLALAAFVAFAFKSKKSDAIEAPQAMEVAHDVSPYRGGLEPKAEDLDERRRRSHEQLMIGGAAFAAALVTVLVGRDLVIKPEGSDQPGAIRLLQLFTYNYRRHWPEALDFTAILGGFAVVAVVLTLALGVRAVRRHAVAAFCAFALVWAVWGIDVYMVKMSPHWGQREVIQAYFKDRNGPEEQLVAYQMNWKGENFYTGNHIPAFVSSGATFQTWLKGQREKGVKVLYFVTEHSRTGGLRGEVAAKSYKELTDKALCNKFILIRAEL